MGLAWWATALERATAARLGLTWGLELAMLLADWSSGFGSWETVWGHWLETETAAGMERWARGWWGTVRALWWA